MSNAPEATGWCVTLEFALNDADPAVFAAFEDALTDPARYEAASFALMREEGAGVWRIRAVMACRPPEDRLQASLSRAEAASGLTATALAVAPLVETDWVDAANRARPAVTAAPFHVRGSHVTAPGPEGMHDIVLDAGQAFGTGSHETTRGCLLAIAASSPPPGGGPALDLGTGSGLLAIAMARHWGIPVIAADSDPVAVTVATENAALNGVGDRIETRSSRGFANARLRAAGPYGVIAANILAGPLIRMAPAIARHLDEDGRVLLSGILAGQEDAVRRAYARQGLAVLDRIVIGDWPTLTVGRQCPGESGASAGRRRTTGRSRRRATARPA